MKKGTIIGIIIAILVVGAIGFFGIVALIAMPNLTKVQDRAQVNADIRTAEQISRAITIWSMEEANREIPTTPTKYGELEKIEVYTGDYKPMSLADAEYYIVSDNGTLKVAIAKEASDVNNLGASDVYDGTGAGWAYVEGQY